MLRYTNFLFDWDGTLADSAAAHAMAFRDVLAQWRADLLSSFVYAAHLGRPTRDVFACLGVRDALECARLTQCKQEHYAERIKLGTFALFPGARELLSSLRRLERACFLVTGASRASVRHAMRLTDIEDFFQGVLTADDVMRGKPDPAGFHLCLEQYRLHPESCIVVEDAVHGVAAARAAGLAVVGVHNPAIRDRVDAWFPTLSALSAEL